MSVVVGSGQIVLGSYGQVVPSRIELISSSLANGTGPERFDGLPGPLCFATERPAYGALESVSGPTRNGTRFVAARANGSGVVSAMLQAGAIGVAFGDTTSTWTFRVDETVLRTATQVSYGGLRFWGTSISWQEDDIPVSDGSLFTAELDVSPVPAFFSVDDMAYGSPGTTWLRVWGDLETGERPPYRMRGSGRPL